MQDTPFGKIPDDWGLNTINDACEVVTDYVANGSFKSLADNVEYQDHEDSTVLIRLVDYNNGFNGDFVYVNDHAYEFLAKSKLFGDEIIISNVGANVGTVFRCPHLDKQMTLGPNSVMLKFKQNDDFYFYWLKSPAGQHMLQSIVTGSAQPKFNKTNLRQIVIPVPPEDVQEKIADILMSIDKKIENNNQINRNLQEQAQAVYYERFGSREKSVTLDTYPVKVYSGGTPSTKNQEYWDGDIPWLSSGETAQAFVVATDKYITEEGLNNSSTKWAEKYDVVTASAGQGHTRGQTSMLLLNTCINQSVIVTHAEKKYMPLFFFNISGRYDELRVLSDGTSTRGSLTTKIIAKLPMPYISVNEIEEFAEFAWPIIDQIESNQIANSKLNDLRDAILPRLMSGELDVSDIEI